MDVFMKGHVHGGNTDWITKRDKRFDLHANCLHTTQPHMTPKERADKCGCIHMIGFKICCECREYQEGKF